MKFKTGQIVYYKEIKYVILKAGCKIKTKDGWKDGYSYWPSHLSKLDRPVYVREAEDFESKFTEEP